MELRKLNQRLFKAVAVPPIIHRRKCTGSATPARAQSPIVEVGDVVCKHPNPHRLVLDGQKSIRPISLLEHMRHRRSRKSVGVTARIHVQTWRKYVVKRLEPSVACVP